MAYRKYLLAFLCCAVWLSSRAQSIDFVEADSVSLAQYQSAAWQELVNYGQKVITSGTDFPQLRLRMAYAEFELQNYSAALKQYNVVLADDSHNATARYYSYLCNVYLNRNASAYHHLNYLGQATLEQEKLNPYGVIQAGFETSVKIPTITLRGNGVYSRVNLANRLGWRVQLDQSVAYFGQSINYRFPAFLPYHLQQVRSNSVHQAEYFGKLGYTVSNKLAVWGAYHYLNTKYEQTTYHSHIALLGLKYSHPYFDLQADVSSGSITDNNVRQYNTQLSLYPLGNLKLYSITRGSVLHQINNTNGVFSQLIGFKLAPKVWMETNAIFGSQNNYLEADGLYLYNALDIIKFRAGATGFLQLNRHALLYLNYTHERKDDYYHATNYNQHSITGGFTWKF